MMSKILRLVIFWSILITALNYILFRNLAPNEIIFSGDQFLRLTKHETLVNSFFLRKNFDLGVMNGWQYASQFWDANFYRLIFEVTKNIHLIEKIHFNLILIISLIAPYYGFYKLSQLFDIKASNIPIASVSFFFAFNPYTLELWHGGAYNIGSALTYCLSPLIIYHFYRWINSTVPTSLVLCAVLLCIASQTFWLFSPFFLLLTLLYVFLLIKSSTRAKTVIQNGLILLATYLPLVLFLLYGIAYELIGNATDNNSAFAPTYGNMQGGLLYQAKFLFSWAIYTEWYVRSLYPFGAYFFSKPYNIGIFILYFFIFIQTIYFAKDQLTSSKVNKNQRSKFILFLYSSLLISIFFAKGAQEPLGSIFTFLYENVTLFKIFRTPDIRFGFIIILTISCLILLLSSYIKSRRSYLIIFIVSITLSFPFFNGDALKGENVEGKYIDRIIEIPDQYLELSQYINKNSISPNNYILSYDTPDYGAFKILGKQFIVGQDLLPMLIEHPFLYNKDSRGMSSQTFSTLNMALASSDYALLSQFPIEYLLIRADYNNEFRSPRNLELHAQLVFKNSTFLLYKLNKFSPAIAAQNITFTQLNPTKYFASFSTFDPSKPITLTRNYDENWKLYVLPENTIPPNCLSAYNFKNLNSVECLTPMRFIDAYEVSSIYATELKALHSNVNGLNQWDIDSKELNSILLLSGYKQDQIDSGQFKILIYLKSQFYYWVLLFTSASFFACYLLWLLIRKLKS